MGAWTTDFNYRATLAPSPRATVFIVFAGGATVALVVFLSLVPLLRLAAIAWVGATCLAACRSVAARRRDLVLRGAAIDLRDEGGEWRTGQLRDGSFVAPWLTIVRWRAAGERFDRTVAILPDMIDAARFRELRVLLRHQPGTDPSFLSKER